MTLASDANKLLAVYVKLYTVKYKEAPALNRHKEKWGFQDMIKDLGYARAREVLEYYMELPRGEFSTTYLFYNYEKLSETMYERERDEARRVRLRAETKERVEKWLLQNSK